MQALQIALVHSITTMGLYGVNKGVKWLTTPPYPCTQSKIDQLRLKIYQKNEALVQKRNWVGHLEGVMRNLWISYLAFAIIFPFPFKMAARLSLTMLFTPVTSFIKFAITSVVNYVRKLLKGKKAPAENNVSSEMLEKMHVFQTPQRRAHDFASPIAARVTTCRRQ